MKILRAAHLGMCFGVRDAIQLALQHSQAQPLTILGELVHNRTVLAQLGQSGIRVESRIDAVETAAVMITAHGASQLTMEKLKERNLKVIEATCPLVHHAHRALQHLVAAGWHPVVIGRRDHVEVRGLSEDLQCYDVVLTESDVDSLVARERFGVIAQTTQPIEKVQTLVERMRGRFGTESIRFVDTVCQPTKQRQEAAIALARACDVVVVIGGTHSNNTQELAATCRRYCERVVQVQGPEEMHATWFRMDDTVGITAGTSTPDVSIDGVEQWLLDFVSFQEILANHHATG